MGTTPSFSFTEKLCPKCCQIKPIAEYHVYFSKPRNKHRISNYCKPCGRKDANKRAKVHFENNKEAKLQYAKDYRSAPVNKDKLKAISQRFKAQYRQELKDCYVRDVLRTRNGIPTEISTANPELVEARRLQIKIRRQLNKLKNGKK